MYLVGVLSAFMVGGIFALLVRLSLLNASTCCSARWVTVETYSRFFTLHGAIMVFLFIILPFRLPRQRGSAADAGRERRRFPRLNLAVSICGSSAL
jgi:cytochrome c oxidase subunit 1